MHKFVCWITSYHYPDNFQSKYFPKKTDIPQKCTLSPPLKGRGWYMPETTNDSYEVENDNNDGRCGLKSREGRKNQLAISNGQQLPFMLIITWFISNMGIRSEPRWKKKWELEEKTYCYLNEFWKLLVLWSWSSNEISDKLRNNWGNW